MLSIKIISSYGRRRRRHLLRRRSPAYDHQSTFSSTRSSLRLRSAHTIWINFTDFGGHVRCWHRSTDFDWAGPSPQVAVHFCEPPKAGEINISTHFLEFRPLALAVRWNNLNCHCLLRRCTRLSSLSQKRQILLYEIRNLQPLSTATAASSQHRCTNECTSLHK